MYQHAKTQCGGRYLPGAEFTAKKSRMNDFIFWDLFFWIRL